MRCVGVCASVYQNNVAVPRRFLLFLFARNDLSKIPQMLSGALRVADRVLSGSRCSLLVGAGARERLILSVFALTALTSACANVPPEVGSWHFLSGWSTIVSDPVATRQSASAAGWRTEVIPYETEWP
jgi:hypothetical protein